MIIVKKLSFSGFDEYLKGFLTKFELMNTLLGYKKAILIVFCSLPLRLTIESSAIFYKVV